MKHIEAVPGDLSESDSSRAASQPYPSSIWIHPKLELYLEKQHDQSSRSHSHERRRSNESAELGDVIETYQADNVNIWSASRATTAAPLWHRKTFRPVTIERIIYTDLGSSNLERKDFNDSHTELKHVIAGNKNTMPCVCTLLHSQCPPACKHAKFSTEGRKENKLRESDHAFEDLEESAREGCGTCQTLLCGLYVPAVKGSWEAARRIAIHEERCQESSDTKDRLTKMSITILKPSNIDNRIILRTKASDDSRDWRHFAFHKDGVEVQDPRACNVFRYSSAQPVLNTYSLPSIKSLWAWLRTCQHAHRCYGPEMPVLPSRVIAVNVSPYVPSRGISKTLTWERELPCVINAAGIRAHYMTLSHCWGNVQLPKLQKGDPRGVMKAITWNLLPSTYRQAIAVTRFLGIAYIWIDSMCIIQDDPEDWQKESVNMRRIYGNSYLNIAANYAKDASGGLFSFVNQVSQPQHLIGTSKSVYVRELPVRSHDDYGSNYGRTSSSPPLLTRAWVLQERLLAPRNIYFGQHELLWECDECAACQCGAINVIQRFKLRWALATRHKVDKAADLFGGSVAHFWMRVVERYSTLDLTFDQDRLVALSGIAQQVQACFRGEQDNCGVAGRYLAGLWEQDLAHQSCWYLGSGFRKSTHYLGPSWSWVSKLGDVYFDNRMDFEMSSEIYVEIMEVSCEPVFEQTGPVKEGHIRLNGQLAYMTVKLHLASEEQPASFEITHEKSGFSYVGFRPDTFEDSQRLMMKPEVALLFWGLMVDAQACFLILQPIGRASFAFERVGLLSIDCDLDAQIVKDIFKLCHLEQDILIF